MPSISPTVGRTPAANSFLTFLGVARAVMVIDTTIDGGERLWEVCREQLEEERGRALTQHQSDVLRKAARVAWCCRPMVRQSVRRG